MSLYRTDRGQPWQAEMFGEILLVALYTAPLIALGWLWDEPVPSWAIYLAACIGILRWNQ